MAESQVVCAHSLIPVEATGSGIGRTRSPECSYFVSSPAVSAHPLLYQLTRRVSARGVSAHARVELQLRPATDSICSLLNLRRRTLYNNDGTNSV
jgi:hypothetical protein